MNTDLLKKVEKNFEKRVPQVSVGDQVEVHTLVREKNRQRIQVFKGLIIAIKGSGIRTMITVRKISSGIGVEKIWPLHSPNIKKIVITKKGNIKRSKLYYLRDRIGKKALKVRTYEGLQLEDFYAVAEEESAPEEVIEDEVVEEEVAVEEVKEEETPESKDEETADKDSK